VPPCRSCWKTSWCEERSAIIEFDGGLDHDEAEHEAWALVSKRFCTEGKSMARKKQNYIKGTFTHRRTEADYMGALLDAVTLEDWRSVVAATVAAAKAGDPSG
jgi:hypothetical protein